MNNVIQFRPQRKNQPSSKCRFTNLSEADLRWRCAATQELRRLRDLTGEASPVGERLDQAYRVLLRATVEIADIGGW
ncbi:hypothetical protein [Methylocaldum szegediense]|uniref:Uncharacterized protein n=1 Tax=Methylocaldum szegediense TaxID=73780 RepID=A0ABN8X747_9GAMM|nr:hypothetical protein [Methylocaldum szegediense]CAI8918797.1 protein of unknown function [Methylocaldum szegediense]